MFIKPAILPIEAIYTAEGQIKEGLANSVRTEYIQITQDEYVGSATITITPITNIGQYEIDVGVIGTDWVSEGEQTFIITKNLDIIFTQNIFC